VKNSHNIVTINTARTLSKATIGIFSEYCVAVLKDSSNSICVHWTGAIDLVF